MNQKYVPNDVSAMMSLLGERICTARTRRRWSMDMLAQRVGVGRRTIKRMENGDAGIALGIFLTTLWTLGLWNTVDNLAFPAADKVGEFLEKQRQPKRVRQQKESELDF